MPSLSNILINTFVFWERSQATSRQISACMILVILIPRIVIGTLLHPPLIWNERICTLLREYMSMGTYVYISTNNESSIWWQMIDPLKSYGIYRHCFPFDVCSRHDFLEVTFITSPSSTRKHRSPYLTLISRNFDMFVCDWYDYLTLKNYKNTDYNSVVQHWSPP